MASQLPFGDGPVEIFRIKSSAKLSPLTGSRICFTSEPKSLQGLTQTLRGLNQTTIQTNFANAKRASLSLRVPRKPL